MCLFKNIGKIQECESVLSAISSNSGSIEFKLWHLTEWIKETGLYDSN